MRNPVFGVCNQVRLKPTCSATETRVLKFCKLASIWIIPSRHCSEQQRRWSYCADGQAAWSASLLFAYICYKQVFSWCSSYIREQTWFSIHEHLLGPEECWKPQPERWGFQLLLRGSAMLVHTNKLIEKSRECHNQKLQPCHVWSLLLNKSTQQLEIFEENALVNLYYLWQTPRRNGTFTACVFKTPFPGQIPTSCWLHGFMFATVHVIDADVTFCDGPVNAYC